MSAVKVPIGKILVENKAISHKQLSEALISQQISGEPIGRVLLGRGSVNPLSLYKALAQQYNVEFADLKNSPPDRALLKAEQRKDYLSLGVMPWRKEGEGIIIAATDINQNTRSWAEQHFDNFRMVITSPYDIYWTIQKNFAREDDEEARLLLWKNNSRKSARDAASPGFGDVLTLLAVSAVMIWFFQGFLKAFFVVINLFYLLTMAFKVLIFVLGKEKVKEGEDISHIDDRHLPVYTLLVPMYKEKKQTIKNLVSAVRALEYPKEKLDVKLIIESDDYKTIEAIKSLRCESIFEIIRVPYSIPRTKPKAMNYALRFARGEYVTIYDAEDHPEPKQLKKVIAKFMHSNDPKMACVQARLNYYNRDENVLTRMFAIEYSSWFDFMLDGLEELGIPIPLGGTSNHFPIDVLKEIYAWDPFNVTEDADLGIRLAEAGYKTSMVNSHTLEESPVTIAAWMKQRARWIKGYMQTYLVHMRKPASLYKSLGIKGFFGFQFFVGAPSLVFLSIPFMFITSGLFLLNSYGMSPIFTYFAIGNLILGFLMQAAFAAIVLSYNKWWKMWTSMLLFPFYWFLHTIASFKAVWGLIVRPYYWDKTEHGVSRMLMS